jgi:opacity protein-like surface antigen
MTIKQARIAAAAALALSSSVAMADGFQFQKGFYLGANTGAAFVTGQTYAHILHSETFSGPVGTDIQASIREEASARGYTGGITLGWDFYNDREFIYGLALSGTAYSNRAYQTSNSVDQYYGLINLEESWDLQYSADLTFKPGWFISDSTELYAILGGSVAQVTVDLKNVTPLDTFRRPLTFANKATLYGFVVGAGVQKQLSNRLSAFAAYQYTYYGRAKLDPAFVSGTSEWPLFASGRELRLDANVLKVGLVYTF